MSTKKDSMFFLDRTGAEKLLGNGDGLYFGSTGRDPIRVQTPYISEEEIKKQIKLAFN
jgi:S-DNA-T family DNA segregation ATPase FtsK/SpoIIIE